MHGIKKTKKRVDLRSSPIFQVPREGTTNLPPSGLSIQFQVLDDISPSFSEVEARGQVTKVADAKSSLSQEHMSLGGGTSLESGWADEKNMFIS